MKEKILPNYILKKVIKIVTLPLKFQNILSSKDENFSKKSVNSYFSRII